MAAPVAVSDTRPGVKYGYTINSSPAARCGHRCCFFPYTNSTNPTPPGISETNSHVGSKVMNEGARSPSHIIGRAVPYEVVTSNDFKNARAILISVPEDVVLDVRLGEFATRGQSIR